METEVVDRPLRSPDRSRYPELAGYTRDQIYGDCLGGGSTWRASGPDQPRRVISCSTWRGKGTTSIFLAREFGAQVVALDLWTSATFLADKFAARGLRQQIVPLTMDVTGRLPFAEGYFDAIFCMNSLSFYGGSVEFLQHLLVHLKPGGLFAVGMETLTGEFMPEQRQNPPAVYSYNLPPPLEHINVWTDDFSKCTPPWWERLFTRLRPAGRARLSGAGRRGHPVRT
jgi:SAM-dependent methyltransferase